MSAAGLETTVPERIGAEIRDNTDEVQLCLGSGQEPDARTPGRGRPTTARFVLGTSYAMEY